MSGSERRGREMVYRALPLTLLATRVKGLHYYLYMIVGIYSRKIVGWEVHERENGELASQSLQRSVWSEKCSGRKLTLHSDNGSPMKCMTMQAKMYELGIAGSRSRPGVSNDNPYSESLFRTLKYCPRWPSEGFESLGAARVWVTEFVRWYNLEHRHSRIKFVTLEQRHRGEDKQILIERQKLYEAMRTQNPNRWSGCARNWTVQGPVELNPEQKKDAA